MPAAGDEMSCTTTPSSSGSSRSRGVCAIALVAPADGGSVGVSGAPSAGGQVPPAGMETAAAAAAPALGRVVEEKVAATAAAAALVLIAAAEVVVLLEACSQQQHQKSAVGVVEGTTIGTMSQEERRKQEGQGETQVEMGEGELKLQEAEDEEEKDDDEDEDDEDEEDEEEDEDDKEDIMRSSGGRGGAMSAVRFAACIAFAFFTGIGWAIEAGLATPSCAGGGLSQPSAVQLEVRVSGTPAPVTAEGPQQRCARVFDFLIWCAFLVHVFSQQNLPKCTHEKLQHSTYPQLTFFIFCETKTTDFETMNVRKRGNLGI